MPRLDPLTRELLARSLASRVICEALAQANDALATSVVELTPSSGVRGQTLKEEATRLVEDVRLTTRAASEKFLEQARARAGFDLWLTID